MSILIHGMEMPKDGYIDVRLFFDGWAHIPTDEPPYYNKAFEAIELPPHGRLIDADAMERMFADIDNAPYSGFDGEDPFYSAGDAVQIIRLAPTIIPAATEGGADG
jgi:hypothetical protein